MRFKKSFGQNFLRDKRFVNRVISSMELNGDIVIEIGPGSGQITRHLAHKARKLYCVEKDTNLISLLKERFASDSTRFINSDILTFDLSFLKEKSVVFGNIPFNISNRLIRYLIINREFIKKGYFTFQKEFARKLAASFHTKEYGYLSCLIQYYADVKIIFDIPRSAFYPVPGVDASFITIKFFDKPQVRAKNEDFLFKLIRNAFSARRKKIINALLGFGGKEYISRVLNNINIDEGLRPQDLSLKDYCNIADVLSSRHTQNII